ncbi:MAG: hypothetical protein RL758_1158, partial [Pseudomonadota bacterium]
VEPAGLVIRNRDMLLNIAHEG